MMKHEDWKRTGWNEIRKKRHRTDEDAEKEEEKGKKGNEL